MKQHIFNQGAMGLFDPRKVGVTWPNPADDPTRAYVTPIQQPSVISMGGLDAADGGPSFSTGETEAHRAAIRAQQEAHQAHMAAQGAVGGVAMKAYYALGLIGATTGVYHGYKRNKSVGWAIVWGLLGGSFPFFTIPVSLAQGFAKAKAEK